MRYSEFPHEYYLTQGTGPGAGFLGDLERWNWRWALQGTTLNASFDDALSAYFNEAQRRLMRMEPAVALISLEAIVPSQITEAVRARLGEAQARLFGPRVVAQDGNVIRVNFKRA